MTKNANNKTKQQDPKANELIEDLKRVRADFENYRKNSEIDKQRYGKSVKCATLMKIIPIIDDIERATNHLPEGLKDNDWAKGIIALREKLLKDLIDLGIIKINTNPGTVFDPNYHEAVQVEDEGGDNEVVSQELRSGWLIDNEVARPAMVKVARR